MTASRFDRTKLKTARARRLRRDATRPEQKLWFKLRGGQLGGTSFRRQHPVGPYVLDFYCPSVRLAIELDGDQHGTKQGLAHDATRTRFLQNKGIRVLRFWNNEIKENLEGVCDAIDRALTPTRNAARSDLPLSGGGKQNLNI